MVSKSLLLLLQALAVVANPNFHDVLQFHRKRQTPQQALSACSAVSGVFSVCESVAGPAFYTLPPASQARCACYYGDATSVTWIPDFFDAALETCASAARTLDQTLYSSLRSFDNLCHNVGDLRTQAASLPVACSTVLYAISVCNSLVPGLSTLGNDASAACMCYDSTTWLPNRFDGAVQTCAAFLQTASPKDFQDIQRLDSFCSKAGDLLKPANVPASTTNPVVVRPTTTAPNNNGVTPNAATPSTTAAPSLTGLFTFPACSAVGSAIASCESASPGFTTAGTASQAACICYTQRTSWVPNRFDSPVSSCADFVQTASPENFSLYDNLKGFCSFVGDIYVTTTTRTTTTRAPSASGSGGGGIGADGFIGSLASRTSSTPSVNPGPATPSSSTPNAAPTMGVVDYWALKVISVVVIIQAFA